MADGFLHAATTVDGTAIHYAEAGSGDPVVLVPGWPETWYAWRRVMPLLAAAGYRAVALDPPGLGDSGLLADGKYDTGRVADLLQGAVKALGLGRYHLVGHDVGTWISFAWGSRHAADLRSLTLLEAALPGITPDAAFGVGNAPKVFQFYLNAVPELPELLVRGSTASSPSTRTRSVPPTSTSTCAPTATRRAWRRASATTARCPPT